MIISQEFNGEYRIIITDKNGMVKDTGWINNLVLNSGLDRMGATAPGPGQQASPPINFIRLGTGTSTPIATQTVLDNQIAVTNCTPSSAAPNSSTFRSLFAPGSVSGTITEIGAGWQATGPTLFSRSKLQTPLSVLITDQLEVLYKVQSNSPTSFPGNGSVTINGLLYTYKTYFARSSGQMNGQTLVGCSFPGPAQIRAVFGPGANPGQIGSIYYGYAVAGYPVNPPPKNIANFNPYLSINPPQPGGITYSTPVYTPGTYYLDCESSWYSSTYSPSNSAGIRGLWVTYSNIACQIYFDTPIPKTGSSTISLTLRTSWSAAI